MSHWLRRSSQILSTVSSVLLVLKVYNQAPKDPLVHLLLSPLLLLLLLLPLHPHPLRLLRPPLLLLQPLLLRLRQLLGLLLPPPRPLLVPHYEEGDDDANENCCGRQAGIGVGLR